MSISNLLQLLIPLREVEHITEIEVGQVFVAGTFRPSSLRKPVTLINFAAKQLLAVGLVWMVGMIPVARWVEGNYGDLATHQSKFVAINSSLDMLAITTWNLYMWRRSKQVKTLLRLLDEIDQFNGILQSVNVLQELATTRGGVSKPDLDVLKVLQLTRQNLLAALQVDRLLRKYRDSDSLHRSLVQEIESNLAALQQLRTYQELNDYGQLLHQACEIGLNVYQELQTMECEQTVV
jgi:hypothetical protein